MSSIDNVQQLLDWQPPIQSALIENGILLPETRVVIFGPAKAWKSMLSLHTAFALASGSDWFGFKTSAATTLKYQAELPKSLDRDRVAKYARGANSYPPNVFFKTSYERVKLDTPWGTASLARDIEEVKSRAPNQHLVLILDPLYKLLAGRISDEYDVKKLQDNLDDLKSRYNFSIIIIHHSRLSRVDSSGVIIDLGSEEVMGSSYWNNWCDTMIRVKLLNPYTGADKVELSFVLARNTETILPKLHIQWSRVDLQPRVLKRIQPDFDEPSIRGLGEPSIRGLKEASGREVDAQRIRLKEGGLKDASAEAKGRHSIIDEPSGRGLEVDA